MKEAEIIVKVMKGLDAHFQTRVSALHFTKFDDLVLALTNIDATDPPGAQKSAGEQEVHFASYGQRNRGGRGHGHGRGYRGGGRYRQQDGHGRGYYQEPGSATM